ncbi:hypothetical protein [Deinococcus aquaticus]
MSAFHVLLHYIPAALRAERAPSRSSNCPGVWPPGRSGPRH